MTIEQMFECRRRSTEMRIFMDYQHGRHSVDMIHVIHQIADSIPMGGFEWFGPATEIVGLQIMRGAL